MKTRWRPQWLCSGQDILLLQQLDLTNNEDKVFTLIRELIVQYCLPSIVPCYNVPQLFSSVVIVLSCPHLFELSTSLLYKSGLL